MHFHLLDLALLAALCVIEATAALVRFNGQDPGPSISARRGDTVIVDVINQATQKYHNSLAWCETTKISMLHIPELADVKAYLINRERLYQCTNDSYACHDSTSPQEGLYRHPSRWVEEALNALQGKGGGKGGLAQGQVGVKKILPRTSTMVSFHQCHKLHVIAKLGNSKMAVYETKKSDSFCLKVKVIECPSIEERALSFLEAQYRVKKRGITKSGITWALGLCFRPLTSRFEAWNKDNTVLNRCVGETLVHSGENDEDWMTRVEILNRLRVTDEEPEHFGEDALPRPPGLQRISKSQRSSNSTASSGSNPLMYQEMMKEQYELDRKAKMKVIERETNERMRLYHSQRIAEDMKVPQIDIRGMDPIDAAIINAQKTRVRALYPPPN
ncbi:enoyl-[acyl-carrier-protein] reductase, mitochondrial [Tanacetum coccineum]